MYIKELQKNNQETLYIYYIIKQNRGVDENREPQSWSARLATSPAQLVFYCAGMNGLSLAVNYHVLPPFFDTFRKEQWWFIHDIIPQTRVAHE